MCIRDRSRGAPHAAELLQWSMRGILHICSTLAMIGRTFCRYWGLKLWHSSLGNRLACKGFGVQTPSVGTMFDLSLREWMEYVKFHSSSPTHNRDPYFTLMQLIMK